jgi:hypothetical protein
MTSDLRDRCFKTLLAAGFAVAFIGAAPQGAISVARTTGKAVIVWQATPLIATMIAAKESDGKAFADLESQALEIIKARKAMFGEASSVSVHVLYAKTGPVNPTYKVAVFAGIERILTVTADQAALKNSSTWPKAVDPAHLPPGVTISIDGKLPR